MITQDYIIHKYNRKRINKLKKLIKMAKEEEETKATPYFKNLIYKDLIKTAKEEIAALELQELKK
jgi:hypothetical protein